jgi:hypothetical protein
LLVRDKERVMETRVVAVAVAVVLAGCSLPADLSEAVSGPETPAWDETELVVALSVETDDSYASHQRALRTTLDYWGANAERYAGHPIEFRLEPNASDPDVRVSVVETVTGCGREDHTAGCAPYVEDLRVHDRPLSVRIRGGFDRASTRLVMKHEFGHVLGLGHDDAPGEIMGERAVLASQPRPDATERALPWNRSTLSVYVDDRNLSADERATVRDQIGHALDYYADGADGTVPANVSFVRVDDRSAADVRILFPDRACGDAAGSCSQLFGPDPDRDGARERYSRLVISVGTVDDEAVGWHVARWLGTGFGHDEEADLPPPLRDATYEERRGEWWD